MPQKNVCGLIIESNTYMVDNFCSQSFLNQMECQRRKKKQRIEEKS